MLEIHDFCPHVRHCGTPKDNPLNCILESSKKLVECQGLIQSDDEIAFKVNLSSNGDVYNICKHYNPADIGKKSSKSHTRGR